MNFSTLTGLSAILQTNRGISSQAQYKKAPGLYWSLFVVIVVSLFLPRQLLKLDLRLPHNLRCPSDVRRQASIKHSV